jgi:hypothetical protein
MTGDFLGLLNILALTFSGRGSVLNSSTTTKLHENVSPEVFLRAPRGY